MSLKNLKVALVCDWLTNPGGAEKVVVALHELFPHAPIYTSIADRQKIKGLEKAVIHTSSLQHYPWAKKKYQFYLGLMPQAFEKFDLSGYDLVISSSHSCAKGIITKPRTLHISYCHSPMRYAWENSHSYIQEYEVNSSVKKIAPFFMHKIRIWDRLSADRVDYFIANSKHIQNRIHKYYRRPSSVIYPFVDYKNFQNYRRSSEDFFLAVGRLTPYKRFDLIIDAFNALGLPLKIVGTGVGYQKLRARAEKNIEFLGFVSNDKLAELYSRARGLVFPQIEDFGITPLEAMASGCPVIAFKKGGALETIVDKKSGIFFEEQNTASLKAAIEKFTKMDFDTQEVKAQAKKFDRAVFDDKMLDFIGRKWEKWQEEMV